MPNNITNTVELDEVLTALTDSVDISFNSLTKNTDSAAANTLFKNIEKTFDNLYVKLRLLENLHDFAEYYIQNEFVKNKTEIERAVLTIEDATENFIDTSKIASLATFVDTPQVLSDRDGTPLQHAEIDGNVIYPGNTVLNSVSVGNISVASNYFPYRRNTTSADNYRSFYCEELPVENSITENIQIIFSETTKINFLDLSAFKSIVSDIKIIRDDNELIPVDISKSNTFDTISAKGIMLTINSKSYDSIKTYILDTNTSSNYSSLNNTEITSVLDTVYDTYCHQKKDVYK